MSKIQRRNNQAGVNHVADLLPTGRALAPREPVRCDLPPVNPATGQPYFTLQREPMGSGWRPNLVDAAKLAFDHKMAGALRPTAFAPGAGPTHCATGGLIMGGAVACCEFRNGLCGAGDFPCEHKRPAPADALRHDSDSEGGHAD